MSDVIKKELTNFIDNQNRKVLGEGRNYQMGFGFCKRTEDGIETVSPISPCKDYLNDVVYCEHMGVQMTAYGLNYTGQGIFKNTDKAYLAIQIKEYFHGGPYPNMEKDTKNLAENIGNLEKFINFFDDVFGFDRTTIEPCSKEGVFIVTFSQNWCKYTYTISMFSLLLRVGQFFYADKEPMDFLENFNAFGPDTYLVKSALPKIKKLMELKAFPDFDLKTLSPGTPTHNYGIVGYNLIAA